MQDAAFEDMLAFLKGLDLPIRDYAIFGSGPLVIRGIIEAPGDLDVICRGQAWEQVSATGTLRYLEDYDVTIAEFLRGRITFGTRWGIGEFQIDKLIDTAEMIDGLPFVRLDYVIEYKQIANRAKDIAHLRALQQHGAGE